MAAWRRARSLLLLGLLSGWLVVTPGESAAEPPSQLAAINDPAGAVRAMEAGAYAEAADFLARYLEEHPDDRRLLRLLGDCHMQLGRWEEAVEAYQGAVAHARPDAEFQLAEAGLGEARARLENKIAFQQIVASYGSLVGGRQQALSVDWQLALGRELSARGQAQEAVEVYLHWLYNEGEHPVIHHRLAQALVALGRDAEAILQFDRLIAYSEDEDVWSDYLELLTTLDQAPRAIEVATEAVARFGSRGPFRRMLAELSMNHGSLLTAARQYGALERCGRGTEDTQVATELRRVVENRIADLMASRPGAAGDFEGTRELVELLIALSRVDDGVAEFEKLVQATPGHAGAVRELAFLYVRAGRRNEARELYSRLLTTGVSDLAMRLEFARLLAWVEAYDAAEQELIELRRMAPQDPRIPVYEGYVALWDGDEELALRLFQEARARNPDDEQVEETLMLLQHRYSELLPIYIRRYNLNPIDPNNLLTIGDLLARMGDSRGSAEVYSEFLSLFPNDGRVRRRYARALAAVGEDELAIRHYLALINEEPQDAADLLEELAFVYLWHGHLPAARVVFDQLLGLEPDKFVLLMGMGRSWLWQGDPGLARRWFEQALIVEPGSREAAEALATADQLLLTYWEERTMGGCRADAPDLAVVDPDTAKPVISWQVTGAVLTREELLGRARALYEAGEVEAIALLYEQEVRVLGDQASRWGIADLATLVRLSRESLLGGSILALNPCRPAVSRTELPPMPRVVRGTLAEQREAYDRWLIESPSNAQAILGRALAEYNGGDPGEAARWYARYLELVPDDGSARLRLGLLLYDNGRYAQAVPHLRSLYGARGESPCLALMLANSLYWSGAGRTPAVDEAIELYHLWLGHDSSATWVWANIARMLQQSGRDDEALRAFQQAMSEAPSDRQLEESYALALVESGRFDEAIALAEQQAPRWDRRLMLELTRAYGRVGPGSTLERRLVPLITRYLGERDDDNVRLEFARALLLAGRQDDALVQFRRYLDSNPTDFAALSEVVGMLNSIPAYDISLDLIDRYLVARPDSVEAARLRADILRWRGTDLPQHRYEIIRSYEAWLEARPNDSEALTGLAAALLEVEEYARAEEYLLRARDLDPLDAEIVSLLAQAQLRNERYEEARASLEHLLYRDPTRVDAMLMLLAAMRGQGASHADRAGTQDRLLDLHNRRRLSRDQELTLARELRASGRRGEALAVYHDHLRGAAPEDPARLELGWLYLERQQARRAAEIAEEILLSRPDDPPALKLLATALPGSGADNGHRRALEAWERYLELEPADTQGRIALLGSLLDNNRANEAIELADELLADGLLEQERVQVELMRARALAARRRYREALAGVEELAAQPPPRAEVELARADLLVASRRGRRAAESYRRITEGEVKATEAEMAQAESGLAGIRQRFGGRIRPSVLFVADSDGYVALRGAVGGGYQFADLRTWIGLHYTVEMLRLNKPLVRTSSISPPLLVSPVGSLVMQRLVLEASTWLANPLQIGGAVGFDMVFTQQPVLDLNLWARLSLPAGLSIGYRFDWRLLALDLRSLPVAQANIRALWHHVDLMWESPDGIAKIYGSYRGASFSDLNRYHRAGIGATLNFRRPEGLRIAAKFDFIDVARTRFTYWDPNNGAWIRTELGYRFAASDQLDIDLEGSIGFFHEDARATILGRVDGAWQPYESEEASVLTYHLQGGIEWHPVDFIDVSLSYRFGQSGPGLIEPFYRAHTGLLNAEFRL